MSFRDMDVTVTMTGEEWFALMAKMAGNSLSVKGQDALNRAMKALYQQVGAASDANPACKIIQISERPRA